MPVIGLDLGKHKFRAVEIEKQGDKLVLTKFGHLENPDIELNFDDQNKLKHYGDELKQFVRDSGFDTNEVVVALPENQVFMRVIKIPKMKDAELKSSLEYEAEQYIPLPLKEITISYVKLDEDAVTETDMESSVGNSNILLVAARKTTLQNYVAFLKSVHLTLKVIEPETLALNRVLGDTLKHPMATTIVDIGGEDTLLIVSYKGYVRFTRNVVFGGDILTRTIQQKLGLDLSQAEEYKRTYGMDQMQVEGKIFEVLQPAIDNLISEIKKSRMFFTSHEANVPLNRTVLCGGTARMPGILMYFASRLDGEVELANPWKKISLSPGLEKDRRFLLSHSTTFSPAIGLALREF